MGTEVKKIESLGMNLSDISSRLVDLKKNILDGQQDPKISGGSLDPVQKKLFALRLKNQLKPQVSEKDFKERFDHDPNEQLDKYRVVWNAASVKLFNEYIDRAKSYLENYRTLSKKDFDRFFWWDWLILAAQEYLSKINSGESEWKFWQKNVWNCYLLAAIRSIIQSPLYEHFICTSVSYNESKKQFTIKIPLWNRHAKSYVIGENVFRPQKNRFYNPTRAIPPQVVPLQEVRWNSKTWKYEQQYDRNRKPKLFKKNKEYLYPIKAPKWLQALEVAFLTATSLDENGRIDRLRMEWWHANDALETILWTNNTNKGYLSVKQKKLEVEKFFDKFHPLTSYATISSIPSVEWDSVMYRVRWTNISLAHSHAYSIIDTDPVKKTVTLVNPWTITEHFTLSYDQVLENFHALKYCKADIVNWFK